MDDGFSQTSRQMENRYLYGKMLLGCFSTIRAVPHFLLSRITPAKAIIQKDVERWLQECRLAAQLAQPRWRGLLWLIRKYPEFRNLFYYRIEQEYHLPSRLLLEISKLTFRRMDTLYFYTPRIGPGLFIEHGFSTVIAANSIGENCWINQQVTIGYSNETDCPTIGNNVRIAAGAKVFGKISLGDNVIIGANAVVCKNVPPNCTVVGVPGYIVRRDGKRVKEPL